MSALKCCWLRWRCQRWWCWWWFYCRCCSCLGQPCCCCFWHCYYRCCADDGVVCAGASGGAAATCGCIEIVKRGLLRSVPRLCGSFCMRLKSFCWASPKRSMTEKVLRFCSICCCCYFATQWINARNCYRCPCTRSSHTLKHIHLYFSQGFSSVRSFVHTCTLQNRHFAQKLSMIYHRNCCLFLGSM